MTSGATPYTGYTIVLRDGPEAARHFIHVLAGRASPLLLVVAGADAILLFQFFELIH